MQCCKRAGNTGGPEEVQDGREKDVHDLGRRRRGAEAGIMEEVMGRRECLDDGNMELGRRQQRQQGQGHNNNNNDNKNDSNSTRLDETKWCALAMTMARSQTTMGQRAVLKRV